MAQRWLARVIALVVASTFGAGGWGQQPALLPVNTESVAKTVEAVAAVVEREYFDADRATRIARMLRERSDARHYEAVKSWAALAERLTIDLFALSNDKHLAVRVVRAASNTSGPAPADTREVTGRRANHGVQRVEVLAGNIGYLNLTSFYRPEEAVGVLTAAMRTLEGADALIVDMRENGGGSPDTVAWLLSYFFDTADLPLFEIVPRSGAARRYTTSAVPIGARHAARPLYVLTARATFSGGEGFPFILQERRRAVVVGEQTAGAANPGRPYAAGDLLEVTVPNGQVRTAVTGQNWDGRGVTPDVPVRATDALRVAHVHALREAIKSASDDQWRQVLQRHLRAVEQADKR